MTNQASEDKLRQELRETLLDKLSIIKYGEAYKWLFDVDKSNVDMWTKDLLALIRTEKLKLLEEVRERVIGENDKGTITDPDSPSYGEPYESTIADKNEQRKALNKLEAEL